MKGGATLQQIDAALAAAPRQASLHLDRGVALRALGRAADAVIAFKRAVALDPALPGANHELGKALRACGRLAEAIPVLREAARLTPHDGAIWLNLGATLLEAGRRPEAITAFRRAVEIEPARPEARNVLGVALLDDGQVGAASDALRAALKLRPDYAAAHHNLGRVYRAEGRITACIAEYRAALAANPDPGTHSNLLYALNLADDVSPADVYAEHKAWAQAYAEPMAAEPVGAEQQRRPAVGGALRPDGVPVCEQSGRKAAPTVSSCPHSGWRLRVGFVSPDLCNHAVAYFLEPLLANRDRREWEAVCYSDVAAPDAVTERVRRLSDRWQDVARLSDEQLDTLVRRDGIDVLVDLAGHTAHNRLRVFARKPAPVQVTWLGYPNTTGLKAIDYRITDGVSDPVGRTEQWHSEQLWRMAGPFLTYRPPDVSPDVAATPAAAVGHVTFGSFSNFAKVSERCLETWAAVLNRVPGSHLILKSRGLGDPGLAAEIHGRFEQRGIAADRVRLDGALVGTREHLDQYRRIDVALDPFPYNGTTTTCEALWMGVPVVTLEGEMHVARVGASLLTHLGATEWIAKTTEEYVQKAVGLARNVEGLSAVRAGLRDRMRASPLCDGAGFAKEWGSAIRAMWERGAKHENAG